MRNESLLKILNTINKIIAESGYLQETLDRILSLIRDQMHVDASLIYLIDQGGSQLKLISGIGTDHTQIDRINTTETPLIRARVIDKVTPLSVYDIEKLEDSRYKSLCIETGFRSLLAVPLPVIQRTIGVIMVLSQYKRSFSREEIVLLTTLSTQLAHIIENSKLLNAACQEDIDNMDYYRIIQHRQQDPRVYSFRKDGEPMVLSGNPASPGYATGKAFICKPSIELSDIPLKKINRKRLDDELDRLNEAIRKTKNRLIDLQEEVAGKLSYDYATIFSAHLMILEDIGFKDRIQNYLKDKLVNAEYAVRAILEEYVEHFNRFNDAYLKERYLDIKDVSIKILESLMGYENRYDYNLEKRILICKEITPSEAVMYYNSNIEGIIAATGGNTSHSVILAKSLEIPAVVGIKNVFDYVRPEDTLLVDGNTGKVYIQPSQSILDEYNRVQKEYFSFQQELDSLSHKKTITKDGTEITLMANVGILDDLQHLERYGAEGIGLYRTEFPFITRHNFPSEEEQLDIYSKMVCALGDQEVVIRTLDAGGDKILPYLKTHPESNPFLGWRSIRISLERQDIFKTQLKAIYQAAVLGNIHLLFPMISGMDEIYKILDILNEVKRELRQEDKPFRDNIPLGVMIEVPSAVIQIEKILSLVDFISIGTNDLIQYTLAVDRSNEHVAAYYDPLHPSVLEQIKTVVDAANKYAKSVALCGEMAGDPIPAILLLGMGLKKYSMIPSSIPVIKNLFRKISFTVAQQIANACLNMNTSKEIKLYLRGEIKRHQLSELLKYWVDSYSV